MGKCLGTEIFHSPNPLLALWSYSLIGCSFLSHVISFSYFADIGTVDYILAAGELLRRDRGVNTARSSLGCIRLPTWMLG
ncbi:unnamed protein product [Musa acuminata subsp. malaccensis]|uniref:(wild Malaysian banana) hypothetical protein n=1 Tax=Musa acuminata subsp. malaccensis TaxID=214687 RepID=A0A804JLJ6_MUSAM|nr:unnamed protein product [Musa acuminata subsp. malaccensis]